VSGTRARLVDAIVFDLDGTLADTLLDISQAMNRALAARAMPQHAPAVYRRLIGGGARELASKVVPADAQAHADAVLAEFRRDYFARPIVHSQPYPGIPELLAALTALRLPLAVLSNKPDAPTRQIVSALFPRVPFVAVYGERPQLPHKPDPQTALALAAELGVAPARCALVGDSQVDVLTAIAAGMVPVAVLWGFRDRPELEASGAAHLISQPAELLEALRLQPAPLPADKRPQ
jgi:phosphoglycolate phosphatase